MFFISGRSIRVVPILCLLMAPCDFLGTLLIRFFRNWLHAREAKQAPPPKHAFQAGSLKREKATVEGKRVKLPVVK